MAVATAEFDYNDFQNRNAADDALLVRFFSRPVKDPGASEEKGYPVFKDADWIDIKIPGTRDGVCRPATRADINRFPRHYSAYKARVEGAEKVDGMALTEWPGVSRAQAEQLTFLNVYTVEQLAALSDQNIQGMMGGVELRQRAKAWVERAQEQKSAADLEAKLAERDAIIETLEARLAALESAGEAPAPRRRGRPRKAKPPEDEE